MSVVSPVRSPADGWGGRHPMDLPVSVVTDSVPKEWVYQGFPFTFVTSGVEGAVEQARFFGSLGTRPVELERTRGTRVIAAPGVTQLRFRVIKGA